MTRCCVGGAGFEVGGGGGAYSAQNVIYVAKHGADANAGDSQAAAKLTIGAAIAAAVAQTPSSSSRWVVYVEDAGRYVENVSLPQYVSLWAPRATLVGSSVAAPALQLADDANAALRRLEGLNNATALAKVAGGTGVSRADIDRLSTGQSASGALNLASGGVLMLFARTVMVAQSGVAVGDASAGGVGHTHVDIEDVYLGGNNAVGIARSAAGSIVGRVAHILETGLGIGNGTGISIPTGTVELMVCELNVTTAYNVAVGATLRLFVGFISGTETAPAGAVADVTVAGILQRVQTAAGARVARQPDLQFTGSAVASVVNDGPNRRTVVTINQSGVVNTDRLVEVSGNDTTPGDLESKLVVTGGLSLSTLNDGGNEQRQIDASGVVQPGGAGPFATYSVASTVQTQAFGGNPGSTYDAWVGLILTARPVTVSMIQTYIKQLGNAPHLGRLGIYSVGATFGACNLLASSTQFTYVAGPNRVALQSPLALAANTRYYLAFSGNLNVQLFSVPSLNTTPADNVELVGNNSNIAGASPQLPATLTSFSRGTSNLIWLAVD